MWYFLAALGVLWLAGWGASYFETSICQERSIWKRIGLMALSFFIWPYVAWCMMRQMG